MQQAIQSDAFRQAALRSERSRIIGILIVMAVLAGFDLLHRKIAPHPNDAQWLRASMSLVGLFSAYEAFMLWRISRAQRRGRTLWPWVWPINTIIECSLP